MVERPCTLSSSHSDSYQEAPAAGSASDDPLVRLEIARYYYRLISTSSLALARRAMVSLLLIIIRCETIRPHLAAAVIFLGVRSVDTPLGRSDCAIRRKPCQSTNRGPFPGNILVLTGSASHAEIALDCINELRRRAGAGVVSKSKSESELQEVNNKLEALRKAVLLAEKI